MTERPPAENLERRLHAEAVHIHNAIEVIIEQWRGPEQIPLANKALAARNARVTIDNILGKLFERQRESLKGVIGDDMLYATHALHYVRELRDTFDHIVAQVQESASGSEPATALKLSNPNKFIGHFDMLIQGLDRQQQRATTIRDDKVYLENLLYCLYEFWDRSSMLNVQFQ